VQDRCSQLAKENELALRSADTDAQLKRVPPASLVASTGNQWKELSVSDKASYEERAKSDRKRYEEQMAKYQPPDKQANRKRNKTGYNMFFSAHVLRLKQSESGVPSERGSVARLVGNAWKQLNAEEKQYYEKEADKQNGMNPVGKEEDDDDEEAKRAAAQAHVHPGYEHMHPQHGGEMHMHPGMAPPMGHPQAMHPQGHHDPRQHPGYYPPPPHMHYQYPPHQGQPPPGYEQQGQPYPPPPQHHQQPPPPPRHSQGGGQGGGQSGQGQSRGGYQQGGHYPPPQQGHYDQRGQMGA